MKGSRHRAAGKFHALCPGEGASCALDKRKKIKEDENCPRPVEWLDLLETGSSIEKLLSTGNPNRQQRNIKIDALAGEARALRRYRNEK
jgi:hypothetical protein